MKLLGLEETVESKSIQLRLGINETKKKKCLEQRLRSIVKNIIVKPKRLIIILIYINYRAIILGNSLTDIKTRGFLGSVLIVRSNSGRNSSTAATTTKGYKQNSRLIS